MRPARLGALLIALVLVGTAIAGSAFLLSSRQSGQPGPRRQDVPAANPSPPEQPQAAQAPAKRNVYDSPLAGRWYEADKETLTGEIKGYLAKVSGKPLPDVCALILPHAGYRWSGQTAAYGIKQLEDRKFRRVIVIGPSHSVRMENVVSVPGVTHYATPLGELPLDGPFLKELRKHSIFQSIPRAHDGEHSVQIELPLLQHTLGEFSLVPVVVGQLDRQTTRQVAKILLGLIDEQSLVVASSDFTHYGRDFRYLPFTEDVAENLKKLDMGSVERIRKKDLDGFFGYVEKTGTTICGRCAIGVLLAMLPSESKVHLLRYETSGSISGDYTSSVSYVSIALTGKWAKNKPVPAEAAPAKLSDEDKKQLLSLARATLVYALDHRKLPTPDELDIRISPAMKRISGAFVTLKKDGKLRGCIGEIFPMRPLYKAVMGNAISAGLNDQRFLPVRDSEVSELEFEVSVLTPPKPVASAEQIVIGKHGIILQKDGHKAVFLPQVAVEQGWKLEETLSHLAAKAGLPSEAWKDGASFSVFEAIVFGEAHD